MREADSSPAAARAARALHATLAALAVARVLAPFLPGMAMWAFALPRFLDPPAAWLPPALAALALLPQVGRRLEPALSRLGGRDGPRLRTTLVWALAAAALVLLFPDRIQFVGDFEIRAGMLRELERPDLLFPQAAPLDVWLHDALPRALARRGLFDVATAVRVLGALEAACLAALAARFARALSLQRAAAATAIAVTLFGGYLGLFTGYPKAFAGLVVAMVGVGAFGVELASRGRGLVPLALCASLGLLLHRSGIAALPAVVVAAALGWRRRPSGGARSSIDLVLAAGLLIATLAWTGPKLLATIASTDASVHFLPPAARSQGILRAAFGGLRTLDLLQLVLFLSPLAIAVPLLALAWRRLPGPPGAGPVLVTLALPFALGVPFLHPAQGFFRDWDDVAACAATGSLLAAWLAGSAFREAPRRAWLAAAACLAVAMPTLQWLVNEADPPRALARIEAWIAGPPARSGDELGRAWEFVGMTRYARQEWSPAAAALARAAGSTPTPAVLREWALAEAQAGRLENARTIYRRLLARDPRNLAAWYSLAAISSQLEDYRESRRALLELLRIDPGNGAARDVLGQIERAHPELIDQTSGTSRRR